MGEMINIRFFDQFSHVKIFKGMIIGLSLNSAEIMLFGDTSKISPGDV
jgi:hypothetical protein